jgi:hypothetical protein
MKRVSSVIDLETQLLISVGSAVAAGCVTCLQNIVAQARVNGIDEKKCGLLRGRLHRVNSCIFRNRGRWRSGG